MTAALIGGVAAGVALSLYPFIMAIAGAYAGVQSLFPALPREPSVGGMLLFMLGLFALWCVPIALSVRRAGELKASHLFFFVLPLPSIVIAHLWQSSLNS